MPDLLVEIGTEELPPRDVAPALVQLVDGVRAALDQLRITYQDVRPFGTPRRLIVHCTDVANRQRPVVRDVRGPAANVAYDAQGRPTQAVIGFARSQGVPVERLRIQEVGDRRYVTAVIEEHGRPAASVLPSALAEAISGLTFTKTMRWGEGDVRFARPVRWVLALLGPQVLRLTVAGVPAGRRTYGHRVLSARAWTVPTAKAYFQVVRKAGVTVAPEDRRRRIETQARALASQVGGLPMLHPQLLDEIVMSVERPEALRGEFRREFLTLPKELLVTVMQHHQKYFAIVDRQHRLVPSFISVRDGGRQHIATVRQGHEWVLEARLADARFFFAEDRTRRLEDYLPRLEGLVFQAQLGTMADKTRRIVNLAKHLAAILLLDGHTTETFLRAATLCKADLVTHLVAEFPELQGTIGQIYAELDGEPTEVARTIGEHYRPAGAGDSLPKTQTGALLGLVDKCDTLVGALAAGLAPTGSQDPYGLRRAAQGIVEIIMMLRLRLPLPVLISAAAREYGRGEADLRDDVLDFLWQRLRALLIEQGIRYDLVDAALAVSTDDLLAAADRAQALRTFASRSEFARLYIAYDRASRILGAEGAAAIDPDLFETPAEHQLYAGVKEAGPVVRQWVSSGDHQKALGILLSLAAPVDRIFDDVLIMAPDPRVRANRLALLQSVVDVFKVVADFSKVVMQTGNGDRGTGNR